MGLGNKSLKILTGPNEVQTVKVIRPGGNRS